MTNIPTFSTAAIEVTPRGSQVPSLSEEKSEKQTDIKSEEVNRITDPFTILAPAFPLQTNFCLVTAE